MRTHHAAAALTAAAVLTLTACGDPKPAPPAEKPAAASPAPAAPQSADPEAARSAAGIPPSPAPAQRAAYLAALNKIDPEIVNGKDDKAVSRGLNQCAAMKDEKDPTKRIASAQQRFIGPNHPDGFGPAKSALIVAAVQVNLCPTY